jgi:hypothetical protein
MIKSHSTSSHGSYVVDRTLRGACRGGCGGSALRLWAQVPCSRMAMAPALHSVK